MFRICIKDSCNNFRHELFKLQTLYIAGNHILKTDFIIQHKIAFRTYNTQTTSMFIK